MSLSFLSCLQKMYSYILTLKPVLHRKTDAEKAKDLAAYTKLADEKQKELMRPSKYKYIFKGQEKDTTGLGDGYPYNWYLGGKNIIHFSVIFYII